MTKQSFQAMQNVNITLYTPLNGTYCRARFGIEIRLRLLVHQAPDKKPCGQRQRDAQCQDNFGKAGVPKYAFHALSFVDGR